MHLPHLATNASQLERWLGVNEVERLSLSMRDWYGPPIAVAGVPGAVYAYQGGDFRGRIRTGGFASALDVAEGLARRLWRGSQQASRRSFTQLNAGFSSLGDLISEATAGKMKTYAFQKAGPTGVAAVTSSLWRLGTLPQAGVAPAAAAAGTAFTSSSVGAFALLNPSGGDTTHFVSAFLLSSAAGQTLLLYDLLFGVAKTMASTATEAVTGVPTRYQSTTTTDPDYIGGNFLSVHIGGTALAATAHNWTVCLYTDQANASSTLPSLTGNSAGIVDRLDHPASQWFAPLEAGDVGIKALTQMQCSASVATGVIWFMIGHPIAWMPIPIANLCCTIDGVSTALNLTRVFDNACLAFLEVNKPVTAAQNYSGTFNLVSG